MSMFGKKPDDKEDPSKTAAQDAEDTGDAVPFKPFSKRGSHTPSKPPSPAGNLPDLQRRSPDLPSAPVRRLDRPRSADSESRRLIVGRDIQFNGEITACDKLIVEGHVQVTLPGARVLEISPTGFFKGAAEVEEADISGRFEGELTAKERLIIRAGGRVNGTVRYGRIVIESGGEISGDMQTLEPSEQSDGGDS